MNVRNEDGSEMVMVPEAMMSGGGKEEMIAEQDHLLRMKTLEAELRKEFEAQLSAGKDAEASSSGRAKRLKISEAEDAEKISEAEDAAKDQKILEAEDAEKISEEKKGTKLWWELPEGPVRELARHRAVLGILDTSVHKMSWGPDGVDNHLWIACQEGDGPVEWKKSIVTKDWLIALSHCPVCSLPGIASHGLPSPPKVD